MLSARTRRTLLTAAALLIAGTIGAQAMDNGNGYSSDPIYCHNQAVNDYWDQVAQCEKSLADDPASLAQCKQDALDDLHRRSAECAAKGSAAAIGGNGGRLSGVNGNAGTQGGQTNGGSGKGRFGLQHLGVGGLKLAR